MRFVRKSMQASPEVCQYQILKQLDGILPNFNCCSILKQNSTDYVLKILCQLTLSLSCRDRSHYCCQNSRTFRRHQRLPRLRRQPTNQINFVLYLIYTVSQKNRTPATFCNNSNSPGSIAIDFNKNNC